MIQPRTARFLRRFVSPRAETAFEREIILSSGPSDEATIYLPVRPAGRSPAWVLLHGVTVPGRHHEAVRRMARALAAAGHIALVPEVPEWTALRVAPREAEVAIRKGVQELTGRHDVDPERIGLIGFSVAGTWGLEAAAGDLSEHIRTVVSIGGYASIQRTLIAMIIGEYGRDGRRGVYRPDPYGRWIMGANLLTLLEGDAYGTLPERENAAAALSRLARTAGKNGTLAREAVYDTLIATLRESVPVGALAAWDLLAAPSTNPVPDVARGRALADALAGAARTACPEIDPEGRFSGLTSRVALLHGMTDTLIPFTEADRLRELLPPGIPATVTITRLFGHTKTREARLRNPATYVREAASFVRFVEWMLDTGRPVVRPSAGDAAQARHER